MSLSKEIHFKILNDLGMILKLTNNQDTTV